METITIRLELNGTAREVDASVNRTRDGEISTLRVFGVELVTATGSKRHVGYIYLGFRGVDHVYTIRDLRLYGYSGMRGNGKRSGSGSRAGS